MAVVCTLKHMHEAFCPLSLVKGGGVQAVQGRNGEARLASEIPGVWMDWVSAISAGSCCKNANSVE